MVGNDVYEARPQWEIVNGHILGAAYRMSIYYARWRSEHRKSGRVRNIFFDEWIRYVEETYVKVHAHLTDYLKGKPLDGVEVVRFGCLLDLDKKFLSNDKRIDDKEFQVFVNYTLLLIDFIYVMGWSKTELKPYERKSPYE